MRFPTHPPISVRGAAPPAGPRGRCAVARAPHPLRSEGVRSLPLPLVGARHAAPAGDVRLRRIAPTSAAAQRRGHRERGQILVLFALAIIPMLGLTGVGLDLGNIYMRYRHAQAGVDAGSLAGMRVVTSGVPNVTYTPTDAQNAITAYVTANAPGATVTVKDLLWGTAPVADQCLSSGVSKRVDLLAATTSELWTAHCLQVVTSWTFPTLFIPVLGISSFTVQTTATATALPVVAMTGMRPITLPDTAVTMDGSPVSPWGPQWDNSFKSKDCDEWITAPVPHPVPPRLTGDPPCVGPLSENLKQYKGLINLLAPPSPPTEYPSVSDTTGCHYEDHAEPPSSEPASNPVGWDNPTHVHPLLPWPGPWDNTTFKKAAPSPPNPTDCTSTGTAVKDAIAYFARYGFGGVINAGKAEEGEGDFFVLNTEGDLGNYIHEPLDDACVDAGSPPTMVIPIPLMDAIADPNHNKKIAVHIVRFAGLQITCPISGPQGELTGTFVNAPIDPKDVFQTGDSREENVPNLTVLKLVA